MSKNKFLFIILVLVSSLSTFAQKKQNNKPVSAKEIFVSNLIAKMTLDEKIGQLNLPTAGDITTGQANSSNIAKNIELGNVGGLFNIKTAKKIKEIQKIAVEKTRLKIPLTFAMDVIHGYETTFPIPLGLSCSWDMKLIERSARIAAQEASADGINWTFSPMVDISRDPRWGRVSEGSGEDAYLGSQIAKAMVKGYQGDDLSKNNTILACVKHFALYGAPDAGREYNTVDMSRLKMYNEYFPPYKAAIDAGAGSVMASFNEIDGIPATGNKWLMTDVLRKQWGFKGFVVTDYTGIPEMTEHGIGDLQTVSALALNAGIEMDMVGEGFIKTLKKSVSEGKVSITQIDKAVRLILNSKYDLGLFQNPYQYCDEERTKTEVYTKENREEARQIAAQSLVLLKNAPSPLGRAGVGLMESFRTEIENPIVQKDIIDLERKIALFRDGKIDDERFRSLRLARGVYGQRQEGVQMIRIKLPYGKVSGEQLHRICIVSDEYSTGRLHITTRQDIQIHYVSLDRTPQLWAELEKDDVTLREACGNTVRNITASENAGIDIDEPFDVTPYAHALFQFLLRNPVNQEMGRKVKISFSSSDKDTALSYLHDLGFIPKIVNGERGFKVMLGGGLGSQPHHAELLSEFIPVNQIIPTTEGVLRIFDRFGERAKRLKARMKFLIKDLGRDEFLRLVEEEKKALAYKTVEIDTTAFDGAIPAPLLAVPKVEIDDIEAFEAWKKSNVIQQKQAGYVAIGIKVLLGDFYTDKARQLADLVKNYAANELRFSLRQNILIRHVKEEDLPFFYLELAKLDFVTLGYDTISDITACPGTDTCNLGIASSTGIAAELERVLAAEYPQYSNNKAITIKISGCMNACGQHNMAEIGFQGMSINAGKLVAPALQVLLGGGNLGNGQGRFSDKVIKIPSRRGPEALRFLLNDFEANANGLSFLDYYDAKGENYFFELLKPLANITNLTEADFVDWGNADNYVKAIGVGECAGVVIDLVATLLLEAKDKLTFAQEAFDDKKWSDAIYLAYAGFVNGAKALLLSENQKTNHHAGIIDLFETIFIESNKIELNSTFRDLVYQINQNEPSEEFAKNYIQQATDFFQKLETYRAKDLANA